MYFEVYCKTENAQKACAELVKTSEQLRKGLSVLSIFPSKKIGSKEKKAIKEQQWSVICDRPYIVKCQFRSHKPFTLNSSVGQQIKAPVMMELQKMFQEKFNVKKNEIEITAK